MYTTKQQYQLEAKLHDDIEALMLRKRHQFSNSIESIAQPYPLSDEQKAAMKHIIGGPDMSVVIGRPGTGKSYLLQPVKDYYQAQQQQVIGAALSGKVAKALQAETGIPSSTIASLTYHLKHQNFQLTNKHVLIIDEAGMVDVNHMAFLMREVQKAGAKIVLLGDPDQLKPIHKGEIFRTLAGLTGYIELENIKRQHDAGDRQASCELAKGNIEAALQHYQDKNAINISAKATRDLIYDWSLSLNAANVRETVLLAFSRKAVHELNEQARAYLLTQGKIGQENIVYQVREGSLQISSGDRLLFRENNKMVGLRNGDLGTVKTVERDRYQVELDTGEQITVPREYRAVDYGYALTVHKSQGMTAKHVKVLIDNTYWDRNLSFVALTRHQESLKIYTHTEHHPTQADLIKTLSRKTTRYNVMDWPLDVATRWELNPDKTLGRIVNHVTGMRQKDETTELNQLKDMLEKRKHLTGYHAEKMMKMVCRLSENHELMGRVSREQPELGGRIQGLVQAQRAVVHER
jgi:Ti-type conjugative transfer relaxase TraA